SCRSRSTSRTAARRSRSGWRRARSPTTSGTPWPTARPSARSSRPSVAGSRACPTDGAVTGPEVVRRADPPAVAGLLASVPEWFGIPEANAQYVADAGRLPSYLAVDGDEVLGVALVSQHVPESRELHLLAVRRDRHRQGIGRFLVEAVVADLRQAGVQ